MKTSRAAETIRFDQGISMAEYNEQPFGQTKAKSEPPILPGSTTVSEALMGVFPESESVNGEIMRALVAGTYEPIWARRTISAVWRSRADLPDMLGPVIIIIC